MTILRNKNHKQRMAIIFSSDYYNWPMGGMLSYVIDIIPYLNLYFDIELWGVNGSKIKKSKVLIGNVYYPVYYFAKAKTLGFKLIPNIIKVIIGTFCSRYKILKRKYDILYFHGLPLEIPFIIRKKRKAIILSHIHGLVKLTNSFNKIFYIRILDYLYKQLRKIIIKNSDISFLSTDVVTYSDYIKSEISRSLSRKIKRIQNFADAKCFYCRSKKSLRKKFGLSLQTKVIVFVGRLSYRKDPMLALRSFQLLIKNQKFKDLFFLVIGSGELLNICMKFSEMIGINNYVRFLGHLDRAQLSKILSASDVFLMTSRAEGTPVSVIEAVLCGLPIVTTEITGISNIVINGYNGYIVNQRDPGAVAHMVEKALENEDNMSRHSAEISVNFTPDKAAYEIYMSIQELKV